jgi:hypothetical protein
VVPAVTAVVPMPAMSSMSVVTMVAVAPMTAVAMPAVVVDAPAKGGGAQGEQRGKRENANGNSGGEHESRCPSVDHAQCMARPIGDGPMGASSLWVRVIEC